MGYDPIYDFMQRVIHEGSGNPVVPSTPSRRGCFFFVLLEFFNVC